MIYVLKLVPFVWNASRIAMRLSEVYQKLSCIAQPALPQDDQDVTDDPDVRAVCSGVGPSARAGSHD